MRDSLFHLSLSAVQELIARREISIQELIEWHLERIEMVNPKINAVIHFLDQHARAQAKKADQVLSQLPKGKTPGPLFGIPFSIKGIFAFQGVPWEVGSPLRKSKIADFTASSIQRCIDAGAIPVAITNVPEASTWIETDNLVYGRTKNPFNPKRTAGGSSGGEAALIASGGSFFGIGTDFGGSIRIPSAFCGVVGHKPSPLLTPTDGQWPSPEGDLDRFCCIGPIGRKIEDLFPVLQALELKPNSFKPPSEVSLKNIRLVIPKISSPLLGGELLSPPLLQLAKKLEKAGCTLEEWDHPALRKSAEIWFAFVARAAEGHLSFGHVLNGGETFHAGKEILRLLRGKPNHTLPTLTLAVLEKFGPLIRKAQLNHYRMGEELRIQLESKLGQDGVLLSCAFPRTAPLHNQTKLKPWEFGLCGLMNVFEMPSTTVPIALSADALPIAALFSANRGNDHLCLSVAQEAELSITPIIPGEELLPQNSPLFCKTGVPKKTQGLLGSNSSQDSAS